MRISRRDWLQVSLMVVGGVASFGAEAESPARKVIVTGGHPGDPEYGCGGTVARLTDAGCEVVLLYLNEGEPREAAPRLKHGTRVVEAKNACAVLKARPLFAGQVDGDAVVDRMHYEQFRKLIAAEKPQVVFTHWPIDNHADHRAISMLAYDSWLHLGKSFALYYYEVSDGEDTIQFSPTDYVGISAVVDRKRKACFAHASQSPERFYALQDKVAEWRGVESGFGRAEAFVKQAQSPSFLLPGR